MIRIRFNTQPQTPVTVTAATPEDRTRWQSIVAFQASTLQLGLTPSVTVAGKWQTALGPSLALVKTTAAVGGRATLQRG